MSKRLFWLFIAVCCFVGMTLLLVIPGDHAASQSANNEQSSVVPNKLTDVSAPDRAPTVSATGSRVTAAGEPGQPPEAVSVSATRASGQPSHSTHGTAVPQNKASTENRFEAAATQPEKPQAEVSSYPPLLQQNASNNFTRAMETLKNAKTEVERYHALKSASKSDFIFGQTEEARKYATELLLMDQRFSGEPWRDGGAVYEGNFVLGRIAAQEGQTEQAKQYLLEAGKSTGSPVLGSFGPNMSLAKDLLQAGERDTVLEYFELCRKFWSMGNEKLTLWSEAVKAGQMPDFGSNLYY